MAEKLKKAPSQPTKVTVKVISKQSTSPIQSSRAKEPEDEFKAFIDVAIKKGEDVPAIINPPYDLTQLEVMVHENNSLAPCIASMTTNIDGTGHELLPRNKTMEDASQAERTEVERLTGVFNSIYMGKSFMTLRKFLRWEQEATGNSYTEVLRTVEGQVAFLREIKSRTMRLVALESPVKVSKEIRISGKMEKVNFWKRERKYVQLVNSDLTYFAEFGASRYLDRKAGTWSETMPVADRATEVLHNICLEDVTTPYGIPRWIGQLPSVLGSREAELFNLDYLRSGGVPPMMITVSGGALAAEAKKDLETLFNSGGLKNKIPVVEAWSVSGDLDSVGSVRVEVHRFSEERMKDSMFEAYDEKCFARVRTSFRIPPIIVGRSTDFSYATAFVSYMVAESQVFAPERWEYDEMVNTDLMPSLTDMDIVYKSLALPITNMEAQLKAMELAQKRVTNEDFIHTLNSVANLDFNPLSDAEAEKRIMIPKTTPGPESTGPNVRPVSTKNPPRAKQERIVDGVLSALVKGGGVADVVTQIKGFSSEEIRQLQIDLADDLFDVLQVGNGAALEIIPGALAVIAKAVSSTMVS